MITHLSGQGARTTAAHSWHALAMPSPHSGGTITPTEISSPAPGVPQRMQACPSAWVRVRSRLAAAWQAIITV